ncbi:MAG: isoprenylcysteine carboxylmethyltransferase family protein [Anaerolineales bacterium]|jgi:protein-S-isoprenylcysteine O-methyltransferase Ste14
MNLRGPIYVFAAFGAYSALHSLLATRGVKKWVRERFGEVGKRYYRLFYNIVGVVTLLPVLVLLALVPGEDLYSWSRPWLYLTLLLQFAGALIILVGLLQTGIWSFFGLDAVIKDNHSDPENLITSGLYAHMRHPLYTGGLLMIWFMPVMTTSLLAFNLAATLYLYIGSIFEERRLIFVFGERYEAYRKRVPRFMPNFLHNLDPGSYPHN